MSPEVMRQNLVAKIRQTTGRRYPHLEKVIDEMDFQTAHEFYGLITEMEYKESRAKRVTSQSISRAIRSGLR